MNRSVVFPASYNHLESLLDATTIVREEISPVKQADGYSEPGSPHLVRGLTGSLLLSSLIRHGDEVTGGQI
jgi:hypothetical protein